MKLTPIRTAVDYQIPLSMGQFVRMTYLDDNDLISLSKDHDTDVEIIEMNGHFGSNIFIRVHEDQKSDLPKFLKWLDKTSKPTKEYIQGLKDGENGVDMRYSKEEIEHLFSEDDDADNSEYDEAFEKWYFYDEGHRDGARFGHDRCILAPFEKH